MFLRPIWQIASKLKLVLCTNGDIVLTRALMRNMPTCVLRYCKSRSSKTTESGHSFFSFPPVSNEIREKWIKFVQLERKEANWLPSAASKLCSKHFKNEDIRVGKTGRNILKKGSFPISSNEDNEKNHRTPTPVDVALSDSESIFDTPTQIALKTQVRALQKQKIRHQTKIKKLSQQNRHLKKKVLNLKNFLRALVKKFDLQRNMTNPPKVETKIQSIYDNQP